MTDEGIRRPVAHRALREGPLPRERDEETPREGDWVVVAWLAAGTAVWAGGLLLLWRLFTN